MRHTGLDADPVGVDVSINLASSLHCISLTTWLILTKLALVHYCKGGKSGLDFGDHDRILKTHTLIECSNRSPKHSDIYKSSAIAEP